MLRKLHHRIPKGSGRAAHGTAGKTGRRPAVLLRPAGGSCAEINLAAASQPVKNPAKKAKPRIDFCRCKCDRSSGNPEFGKERVIPMTEEIGTMAGAIWHALE